MGLPAGGTRRAAEKEAYWDAVLVGEPLMADGATAVVGGELPDDLGNSRFVVAGGGLREAGERHYDSVVASISSTWQSMCQLTICSRELDTAAAVSWLTRMLGIWTAQTMAPQKGQMKWSLRTAEGPLTWTRRKTGRGGRGL